MSLPPTAPAVLIVDDDHSVRDSLSLLLGLRGYATLCWASGDEFLAAVDTHTRGCVLLDYRMPGKNGLVVQAELAARGIDLQVIMLTAHGDAATARAALKSGAFDFLEKPFDEPLLIGTIDSALARDAESHVRKEQRSALEGRLARLTPREREVLELVIQGRHNREVASELGISPRTVEVYKARIMEKLQVARMPELMRLALMFEIGGSSSA